MAVHERNGDLYTDDAADILDVLKDFAETSFPVADSAECVCVCGHQRFRLLLDDDAGAAVRCCTRCQFEQPIGDSNQREDDADLDECSCLCEGVEFELTVGVALQDDQDTVAWVYIGCRCPECQLTGCYGDWESEFKGYRTFLAQA